MLYANDTAAKKVKKHFEENVWPEIQAIITKCI